MLLCYSNLKFPLLISLRNPQSHFKPSFVAKGHILSLSFELLKIKKYLSCSSSSQARVTSPKSLALEGFPNSYNIQPELRTILLHISKHCCSLSGARMTLVQQVPNIAWVSFDLQEHKIHNNVSLVMGHWFN